MIIFYMVRCKWENHMRRRLGNEEEIAWLV